MSKAPSKHTKSKPLADTIPYSHYGPAANHYNRFAKQFKNSNLVPKSKIQILFTAIMYLSRCKDPICFCRECRCFFLKKMNLDPRHAASKYNKTIRSMIGKYKISTIVDMKDAVNNFYHAFDSSYITKDGWK